MPFVKGKSGNPGGRPKDEYNLRDLAKTHTIEAVTAIYELMQDVECPHSTRLNAACALLDRGYGKPTMMMEHTGKDGAELPSVDFMETARRIAFTLVKAEMIEKGELEAPKYPTQH